MTPTERIDLAVDHARKLFLNGTIQTSMFELAVEKALDGWILRDPETHSWWRPNLVFDQDLILREVGR